MPNLMSGQFHPPPWLERNALFRKIYLLRKVFLPTHKKMRFHANAEAVTRVAFQDKRDGFFVDVGCFHPKILNNTWFLYKHGWRGVNIDVDAIKIEAFNWLRPGDANIRCAVSNRRGQIKYWRMGFYSGLTTLTPPPAGDKKFREATVTADTLSNILDATRYKNRPIDFLSVDAEGHDLEVLKSLDFNRYRPGLICVETHLETLAEVMADELFTFLSEKRYQLVGWVDLNLFFRKMDK